MSTTATERIEEKDAEAAEPLPDLVLMQRGTRKVHYAEYAEVLGYGATLCSLTVDNAPGVVSPWSYPVRVDEDDLCGNCRRALAKIRKGL